MARRFSIVRDVAEAVGYAHHNRVVHRGLSPMAVRVKERTSGQLVVVVADCQLAGAIPRATLTRLTPTGSPMPALPGESPRVTADGEEQLFQAPEGG